ncbi:MAG: hypothetical protein FWG44_01310 [Oscillospiraceae bacterium]|nr:hypothetical protein [Oscillospiraceae bacterium]
MRAIHVNSFAPFFAKNGINAKLKIEKFDLYNTVLSALTWRKKNGKIDLVCDLASADYYKKIGITSIWNEVKAILPDDLEGINPVMFWAAGKLLALRETPSPVVMIDTDFIVWKKLDLNIKITAAHREDLNPNVYPDIDYFQMKSGYNFDGRFNYKTQPAVLPVALPLNTAFLYLPDESFKQYYVNMAIDFMKSAEDTGDVLCYMVYAEQRLLALCADRLKQPVETLLDKDRLFEPQNDFTHLWGAKQAMRDDRQEEIKFCQRCADRIRRDYPEYVYLTDLIENIK